MKNYIVGLILTIFLVLSFVGGCQYHKRFRPCPEISVDTILVYDTIEKRIPDTVPYYIVKRDSVIQFVEVPAVVDTMTILNDYFALHYYTREWEDSLLYAKSEDVVSQNQFVDNQFTYQFKQPRTIINNSVDNSVLYSKYLYGALSAPLNDYRFANLGVYFASGRVLLGVGYVPYHKSFNATVGLKIAKFR